MPNFLQQIAFLKDAPLSLSILIGLIFIGVTIWINMRNVNIKERTSLGEAQNKGFETMNKQMETLGKQLEIQSEQLTLALQTAKELRVQNDVLLQQVKTLTDQNVIQTQRITEMGTRINELENIIKTGGCDCGKIKELLNPQ